MRGDLRLNPEPAIRGPSDGSARPRLDGETVGHEFDHLAAVCIKEPATVLGYMRRVDGGDPKIDRLAPRAGGVRSMDDEDPVVRGKVDVEMPLILAEVGCPYATVVPVQRCSDRPPVNQ